MARRASGTEMSLNTFARSSLYSLLSTSTILLLASPPSTPTRRSFNLSTPSIVEPGGAMMSALIGRVTSLRAVDDLEAPRLTVRHQLACKGRHGVGSLTVDRPDCHAQRNRISI